MKLNFDTRPLSWSAISSFEYDPEQWYKKYILNEILPKSKEMEFGSCIGKKIETDPAFMPFVPRHCKMEHPFTVVFSGIKMVGYADSFCTKTHKKLIEMKTGKKAWDQKRANEHGQITLYALFNFITNKIKPEDTEFDLVWLPTQENGSFEINFVEPIEKTMMIFRTKRSMTDILRFGQRITNTVKEMQLYVDNRN